jgi:hypothetical protein
MKHSFQTKFFLPALFVLALFYTSCGVFEQLAYSSRIDYKYGESFNPERQKKGIPRLPKGWISIVDGNSIEWTNPEPYWNGSADWGDGAIPAVPIYYGKRLLIQNETTFIETDVYLGKVMKVEWRDGEAFPIQERIEIIHEYHLDGIDDISCRANVQSHDVNFVDGNCEKAIAILTLWGLSYP